MDTVRINKALADAGIGSRRHADELLAAGRVRVNGQVALPGLRIRPGIDLLEVDGQPVVMPEPERSTCCLMLHKPVEVISTVRDPQGRRTVLDCVPPDWRRRRLYPAGRLDFFSEGLILLTDDGDLTFRLTHPSREGGGHLARVYHVLVREERPGKNSGSALKVMRQGMRLAEGERLAPVGARRLPASPYIPEVSAAGKSASILELTLHQGVNRQIRRMCRDLGLTVLRLVRVAQGPLQLGKLPRGSVRPLSAEERAALYRAAGLST